MKYGIVVVVVGWMHITVALNLNPTDIYIFKTLQNVVSKHADYSSTIKNGVTELVFLS